jgi:hypothetical protein
MTVRAPALNDEVCPKCGAANHDRAVSLWRVADERGLHWQCDCCSWSGLLALATELRVRLVESGDG